MAYQRKTKDVWVIETNYGYGWEAESEYDNDDYENPRQSARQDLKEYKLVAQHNGGQARLRCKRERIVPQPCQA